MKFEKVKWWPLEDFQSQISKQCNTPPHRILVQIWLVIAIMKHYFIRKHPLEDLWHVDRSCLEAVGHLAGL